ncbi:MAG TPA: VOC family protein [Ornithinibacter sp.]|nr:VOC family protein [Ornithinibacter sp.]
MDTTTSSASPHDTRTAGMPAAAGSPATATLAVANCFLVVDDHDAALAFYRDVLGFTVTQDVSMGDHRWLSVATPTQPELEITIQSVGGGPGTSDEDRAAIDALLAKGLMSPLIFGCDDVDALFEHVAASGAEVLQEPTDQFYGVRDCAFRDPAGNLLRFKTALPQD